MHTKHMRYVVVLGAALVAACGGKEQASTVDAQPAPAATEVTRDMVLEAQVTGVLETPVTLHAGRFEGPPVAAGGSSRPSVQLWQPTIMLANLDGVPGQEAAALLSTNSGGSGEFVHLAVFALKDGVAQSVATAPVGDRARLFRAWQEGGRIHMDVIEAGPGEPACCPTQLTRKAFALQDGKLQQVENDVVGALSINLLAATDWMLVEMDGEPMAGGILPPTALVQYEKIAGFAGCNRYAAPITETAAGTIRIGDVTLTGGKQCEASAAALEARFVERLGQVRSYGFVAGQLVLYAPVEGGVPRTLVFAR